MIEKNDNAYSVERANKYILENISLVNDFYKNKYHISSPIGWMNDTNGLVYAFGKYHVFFQYHPYNAEWGPMHWAHIVSSDLVSWEFLGVALAPDSLFDIGGCFSGSSIYYKNTLYILYTGIHDGLQDQVLAYSKDGVNFVKKGIVIDHKTLPDCINNFEFRDPRVFIYNSKFYALVGSKTSSHGVIVLYQSNNLLNWDYVRIFYEDINNKNVCECPDIIIDGKSICLIYGGDFSDSSYFQNKQTTVYVTGILDDKDMNMTVIEKKELDLGFDLYGAQLLHDQNNTLLISWMGSWGRNYFTKKHGWEGSCTFPRVMKLKNNRLYQYPFNTINDYSIKVLDESNILVDGVFRSNKLKCSCNRLVVEIEREDFEIHFFKDGLSTTLKFNKDTSKLTLYSEHNHQKNILSSDSSDYVHECIIENNDLIKLDILIDISSLEVFINDGAYTMTSLVYPDSLLLPIEFEAKKVLISKLEYYEINTQKG